MEKAWFYAVGEDQKGPASLDELQEALTKGEIERRSLVWRQGMPEWQALQEVDELQELLDALPPPLPAQPPPLPGQPPPLPGQPPPPKARAGHGETGRPARRERGGPSAWGLLELVAAVWTWLVGWKLLALIVIPCVSVAIWWWICCWPPPIPTDGPLGQIQIDANPWGKVQWIRGPGGRRIRLPEARTTPLVMSLPPGDYQAQVEYPPEGATQYCDLLVQQDQVANCWLDLAPVDAKAYFEKIGW